MPLTLTDRKTDWNEIEERLYDLDYSGDEVAIILPKLQRFDELRQEKNAILLAHYYQIAPIQIIADHAGDSLALAMAARDTGDAEIIVSSTVHFMAEMVKILSPDKKVLLPALDASCSIAEGMNGATVRRIRESFPGCSIVGYINSTAEVKAELDSTCTSANAKEVAQRIEGEPVILIPDHYFAENILSQIHDDRRYLVYRRHEGDDLIMFDPKAGEEIPIPLEDSEPPMLNKGTCVVHEEFTPAEVTRLKEQEGVELVLAHPEVNPEIAKMADMVGGTSKMIDYVKGVPAQKILYLTECDLAAPLREAYPDRKFVTSCKLCPYMKKNSLDLLVECLDLERYEIEVDPAVAEGSKRSLERMFELTR
ncbi:MAG: quinolinate synthase NadA [Candidatus Omnitrophica bacterium]|nr:quinolinate synthase NadA [Candidatus Omnitrophota bacterium]